MKTARQLVERKTSSWQGAQCALAAAKGEQVWGLALGLASLETPALGAAPAFVLAWREFLRRRLCGMTGDALGAGVEWMETLALLALALVVAP